MSVATLMNTAVNIETVTGSLNSSGLPERTWSAAATGVACRHQDMSEEVKAEYGRLGYEVSDYFYFASNPNISSPATTRLVWNGNAYYVHAIQNQGGTINRVWRVVGNMKPLAYSTSG